MDQPRPTQAKKKETVSKYPISSNYCEPVSHMWYSLSFETLYFFSENHYDGGIMGAMASQITSLTILYSTGTEQIKHQSSSSLTFFGEFTGGRWIPHTNGQWRGKCFHLITSSCSLSNTCYTVGFNLIWWYFQTLIQTSWIPKESRHIHSPNPKIIPRTFHGPGVMLGFQIVGVTFFMNRMHYGYSGVVNMLTYF